MNQLTDFEGLESKFMQVLSESSYNTLIKALVDVETVYVIGNGGLHFVSSHMATDMSRLLPNLRVFSFDSVGFITSNANDHGYEAVFTRWLESINGCYKNEQKSLIIGMSCSGKSANVMAA